MNHITTTRGGQTEVEPLVPYTSVSVKKTRKWGGVHGVEGGQNPSAIRIVGFGLIAHTVLSRSLADDQAGGAAAFEPHGPATMGLVRFPGDIVMSAAPADDGRAMAHANLLLVGVPDLVNAYRLCFTGYRRLVFSAHPEMANLPDI